MCSGLRVRLTVTRYSSQILIKLEFSRQFSKNTEISNFMKIRPEGPELLHADGRTDGQTALTTLIVAFRNLRTRLKTKRHNSAGW